jgi:16S rRNA (guanine(966)-N(2))-methyltransferase RsmD
MDIRPTSDRLRETLFDVLCAGNPSALEQTVWLDLYAGTGAVGIEALSRGASTVYFVEAAARALKLVQRNLALLQIEGGYQLVKSEVARALRRLEGNGVVCDFVFLDPPYDLQQAYHQTLDSLAHSRLLRSGSVVVAEHQKKFDPGDGSAPLERYRKLVQGDAALSFYRMGQGQ